MTSPPHGRDPELDELLASGERRVEPVELAVLSAELRAQVRDVHGERPSHDLDDAQERLDRALMELDETLDELRAGAQEVMEGEMSPWGRLALACAAGALIAKTGTARWLLRNSARLAVAVGAREVLRRALTPAPVG